MGAWYTGDLHKAVEERDLNKIRSLIEDDAIYIDMVENSNMGFPPHVHLNITALHLASKNGYYDGVQLLLEKGADPNLKATTNDDMCWHYFWNSLHYALRYENFAIVELFIESYNMIIDDKALEIIEEYGLINALDFVKKYRELSEDYIGKVNKKCYEIEAMNWYEENKSPYLNHPKINETIYNIFYRSIYQGYVPLVEGMLQQHYRCFGDKINAPIHNLYESEIHDRIKSQFPEICEKLISNFHIIDGGVSYFHEIENTRKAPILFKAILTDNPEMVTLLLKYGADVNATVNEISALDLIKVVFGEEIFSSLDMSLDLVTQRRCK